MTREQLKDAVVEAARKLETAVACKDRLLDGPQQALRAALAALDAHREAPQAVWPKGCTDPNSCGRSRTCNYVGCVHHGEDIGPVVKATLTQLQKMRPHTEAPQETVTLAVWEFAVGHVGWCIAGSEPDEKWGEADSRRLGTVTLPLDREGGR